MQTLNGQTFESGGKLFSRILVATDFSEVSRRALQYAVSLSRSYDSKIYVAHVIPPVLPATLHAEALREKRDSLLRAAEEELKNVLRTIPARITTDSIVMEERELWVAIERLINKHEIDLVIAGTRGVGARSGPFLGSGAEQIFRHSTCPVLTVGPATKGDEGLATEFKNILIVTDFGPSAERAVAYAVSLARKCEAQLNFLHVAEHVLGSAQTALEHLRQIHTQRMKHSLSANHGAGIQADFCVRFGQPADEILSAAKQMSGDLIIMGAKAIGSWVGQVPLSTAYKVVAGASCPVLTVRA